MNINHKALKKLGLTLPNILLPARGIPHEKWAVIACDQHSSDPNYWQKVSDVRHNSPSTLDLILPEAYLEQDTETKIQKIQNNMKSYLKQGILQDRGTGWIYVQRHTRASGLRQGLMLAIDLENYDFSPASRSLVRATEGTILERLPSRVHIRENASVEIPHVMVLINDAKQNIIEGLQHQCDKMEKIYDFELMLGGGRLSGYWLNDPMVINTIAEGLTQLIASKGEKAEGSLLFAVGDGNHSLAAAKLLWENIRDGQLKDDPLKQEQHPARYALVELVNIHSPGLRFEAIHRCFFHSNFAAFAQLFRAEGVLLQALQSEVAAKEALVQHQNASLLYHRGQWHILVAAGKDPAPAVIDRLFARYQQSHSEAKIDFIHGWEHTKALAEKGDDRLGIFFATIARENLFSLVANKGPLPRKAFSMGDAEEKRYYFEARKI